MNDCFLTTFTNPVGAVANTTAPEPTTPFERSAAASAAERKFVPFERSTFAAVPAVAGYVAVYHVGAALAPDWNICPAVAVPYRIAPADAVE